MEEKEPEAKKSNRPKKYERRNPTIRQKRSWEMELPVAAANDAALVDALEAVTQKLGYDGEHALEQVPSWLDPIVKERGVATERGKNRARCVVKMLGLMLDGKTVKQSLAASGMSRAQLTAFRYACPALDKVYREVKATLKEAIGDTVLEAAYDAATEGLEVYDSQGNMCGYRKSEKMMDKLLALAGQEFRKDGAVGASPGAGGGITLNFHFDGKKNPEVTTEVVNVG